MAIDRSLVADEDERASRKRPSGVGINRLDTGIRYGTVSGTVRVYYTLSGTVIYPTSRNGLEK